MMREKLVNLFLFLLLPVTALAAFALDEPFIITLATKAAILALAGVGLNIALGLGGLVSFGHAAFFGIGGYVMGILAAHAQSYTPIMESPFLIEGTKSMPVIWLVAIVVSGLAALLIGALSLRTSGVYFIMVTLAFGQML
ncbi:MAG: branched-chain amino acid ABC transporter permease, partial [Sulfitobacter sp.]